MIEASARRVSLRQFLSALLLPVLLLAGCQKNPGRKADGAPLTDYVSLRQEVIKRVKSGALAPDSAGVIQLPPELQAAAADGKVITANDSNFGPMVLFKAMAFGPNETMGLLYTERPLPASLRQLSIGQLPCKVRRRIDKHWSEISEINITRETNKH